MKNVDPSRPVPELPATVYAVHWPATDNKPESYESCDSARDAQTIVRLYPDLGATAVSAPGTAGPWEPIGGAS